MKEILLFSHILPSHFKTFVFFFCRNFVFFLRNFTFLLFPTERKILETERKKLREVALLKSLAL